MKRGDVVLVAGPREFGKVRPAVIVQSDALDQADSVLVVQLSSDLVEASYYRQSIDPSPSNGLDRPSQIMIDKIFAVRREKIRDPIGHLSEQDITELNGLLTVMLGVAD